MATKKSVLDIFLYKSVPLIQVTMRFGPSILMNPSVQVQPFRLKQRLLALMQNSR